MAAVEGHCADGFEAVRESFEENFRRRGELGAAVSVMAGGRSVVDLWGGWADVAETRPWERDTLVNVWSTTKGVTALCAHLLADRGLLDLDAPVRDVWPEFAAAGKEKITVRQLLAHRAGLTGPRVTQTVADLYDWDLTVSRLAESEPWWEPGTHSGYHALSYGFLVGEVIRRVTGRTAGAYLAETVTGPLGIDFTIGLPEHEDGRAAELVSKPLDRNSEEARILTQLDMIGLSSLGNPVVRAKDANTLAWRRAELPAINGHGTARAVAALYAVLAGDALAAGAPLLSRSAAERAREGQGECVDLVLGAAFGGATEIALGCWLSGPHRAYGPNRRAFGHDGYGGSFGMADPEAGISIGYVLNRMGAHLANDPRKTALIDAVYACL
ncbi:serine hydrolase domain-containing protein [Streptomyces sp. NPDC047108]|uniref:serine hydrolase domain-containing protein n=1 Tax=Streptomyces sp. NPDC047108 TaxID=3155025 RepID=UPI0033C5785A